MPRRIPVLLAAAATLLVLTGAQVAASAGSTPPDVRLLAQYQPLLQFDPLEQFLPTKVQSFLTDADLEQLSGTTWKVVRTNAAPGDLPGPGSGPWRLNQESCTPAAPIGGLACYAAAGNQGDGGPAAYGHVIREDGEIVLQYWFFYYDDVYSYAYTPSDLLWQAHEGDWENVDVVLSADEQPLFVGYSQHCLGQTRAWGSVDLSDATHPIVHVALGSHANYFTAGTHPIDVRCIPAPALALLQAMRLPLPVDYAFAGPTAGPPSAGVEPMPIHQLGDDTPDWVGFPGFWGEPQYLHAPPPIGTVAFGTAPLGPAYHAEWTDPLGTLARWSAG